MSRKQLREHIFKMLFCEEFNDEKEMPQQLEWYFAGMGSPNMVDTGYISQKYIAVVEKKEVIDAFINHYTTGWKTTRMNKVDLAILRLAVYEMKWDEDIPVNVAINEAVELAKQFSSDEGPAFINGVLGKLADEDIEK